MITREIEQEILNSVIKRFNKNRLTKACIERDSLKIELRTKGNFTYCKITCDNIVGIGFSKKHPRDKMIEDIGMKIAFSRACKDCLRNVIMSAE